jgi:hypothetical protein
MPKQTIAKSSLITATSDGSTRATHCLMTINDPAPAINRTNYTFYIWEWENFVKAELDADIHEINALCGNGRIPAKHIITIENDHGFYATPDYSPLKKVSHNFEFIGWHGVNSDGFQTAIDQLDDDVEFSLSDHIEDYITNGSWLITSTLRRI